MMAFVKCIKQGLTETFFHKSVLFLFLCLKVQKLQILSKIIQGILLTENLRMR